MLSCKTLLTILGFCFSLCFSWVVAVELSSRSLVPPSAESSLLKHLKAVFLMPQGCCCFLFHFLTFIVSIFLLKFSIYLCTLSTLPTKSLSTDFALPISRPLGLLSVLGLQWGQKCPLFLITLCVRLAHYAWASGVVVSKQLFPIPMATTFPPSLPGKHALCFPQQQQTCLYCCRTRGRLWGLLLLLSQSRGSFL